MRLGFLGSGNMASALARGIGEPVLAFDPVAERAEALAQATGGSAVATPAAPCSRRDSSAPGHRRRPGPDRPPRADRPAPLGPAPVPGFQP